MLCASAAFAASFAASFASAPACAAATSQGESRQRHFGFGKAPTPAEIAGWNIDVRGDGTGLPEGRGSVEEGQAIYDAKCAACHGTFGESNSYLQIAGGVGTLRSDQPVRTTGSKLNYAPTLWDYIRRAMPFTAPQTLTNDEVYALTAYVLNLNDIVPAGTMLDRASLPKVHMPNRDGFTTEHGFLRRDGKPDTANVACMRDCVQTVRLTSEIPDYARDSHGNLTELRGDRKAAQGASAQTAVAPAVAFAGGGGIDIARRSGCMACHNLTTAIVGPAFRDVAQRYRAEGSATASPETSAKLVNKVRSGGSGIWGAVPMPAQSQLSEPDARSVVDWILAGAR